MAAYQRLEPMMDADDAPDRACKMGRGLIEAYVNVICIWCGVEPFAFCWRLQCGGSLMSMAVSECMV